MNLSLLIKRAKRSSHWRYQHVALILSGSRLLSWGYNTDTLHAEESALRRLDRLYRPGNSRRPKNLHLISFMVRKRDGSFGNSEPCERCADLLIRNKVRRITFVNQKGEWIG
jgi:deoxycytidylate deaminase